MTDQRYPLHWPTTWQRAKYRKRSSFGKKNTSGQGWGTKPLEVGDGIDRLQGELKRLGATHVVISSNLRLNKDGSINRGAAMGPDPGVAVYFKLKGHPRCMACDVWDRLPDNMAAIAGTIEALRAVDRYGVGTVDQAFAGFTALQSAPEVDWWLVLGVSASSTLEQIDAAYKAKAKTAHPDAGGTDDDMRRLNIAVTAARKARG